MRRLIVAIVIACLATGPAEAAPRRPVLLGTDPASDSQPGLDLTYLAAAVDRKVLEIRIGIAGMTPGLGGYPELPGVEWKFKVGGRKFLAEAVAGLPDPRFYLFKMSKKGFEQLENPKGTYDWSRGYASILVPLKTIAAKRGSRITGAVKNDVDAHIHLGPATHYSDMMATMRSIRVP